MFSGNMFSYNLKPKTPGSKIGKLSVDQFKVKKVGDKYTVNSGYIGNKFLKSMGYTSKKRAQEVANARNALYDKYLKKAVSALFS